MCVTFESIPDIAVEIIISSEQIPATYREGNRCDATEDVVVSVLHQFAVGANIKQAAGGIVRTSAKTEPIWEIPICLFGRSLR